MRSYVVMECDAAKVRGGETVFVPDAFAAIALVVPFFWLLWHRLWFAAAMVALVSIAMTLLEPAAPLSIAAAGVLVGIFVALEGPGWRIAKLSRQGWREAGSVRAASLAEAEIRWFHGRGRQAQRHQAAAGLAMAPRQQRHEEADMFLGYTG